MRFGYATLKAGSAGPDVAALQTALNNAYGSSVVAVDGKFGSGTAKFVVGFQKARGLTADGIVGPNTWAALGPYLASNATPMPPAQVDIAIQNAAPPTSIAKPPPPPAPKPGTGMLTPMISASPDTARKLAIAGAVLAGVIVFLSALGGPKSSSGSLNGLPRRRSRRRGFAGRGGLTLAQAKAEAANMGISITKKDGEYRVKPKGGTEAQTYYTNDIEDALGTARRMTYEDAHRILKENGQAS